MAAKTKAADKSSYKVTFGVRRGGKHKKSHSPKGQRPKKYRGQGR
jgi:hypothetical protein